jgi:hypothetical protein
MTNKTEQQTLQKEAQELVASIQADQTELRRLQSGWCEDRFVTLKLSQQIGAKQQRYTTVCQRIRHLETVEENSGRSSSSNVFFGSSY